MFSELGPDRPGNKKNKVWFLYFSLQGLSGMRQMQADGNGDIGGADLKEIPESDHLREKIAGAHTDQHGQKDPQGQKAVQKGKFFGSWVGHTIFLLFRF